MDKEHFYITYRSMWYGGLYKDVVKGTKKDLFAYIGHTYSNSIEEITRMSYKDVKSLDELKEFTHYYTVTEDGNIRKFSLERELGNQMNER